MTVTADRTRGTPPPLLRPEKSPLSLGLLVKLALLAVINGLAVFALTRLVAERSWVWLGGVVVATLLIDFVYLTPRSLPLKYILPGTVFLAVFVMYPALYTAYVSFTNYGTGNRLTKDQAIEQLLARPSQSEEATGASFEMVPLAGPDGGLALFLVDADGRQLLGTAGGLVEVAPDDVVTDGDGDVSAVGVYAVLSIRDAQDRQAELLEFEVPGDAGVITVQTFNRAVIAPSRYSYDPASETLTDNDTGVTYTPREGAFTSGEGERLTPGWTALVGFDNFREVLTSSAIRGPFVRVFLWTYAFAGIGVLVQFGIGLLIALALNEPRMRGRSIYRSLMVIPYALPSFIAALLWAGLFNREFGAVNKFLLGGADIPWLLDPWLAKLAVLTVVAWTGFAYFFLVCTGALQSIPGELKEAAAVDGASGFAAFRRVTFPLLMIPVAPLLIASFAFNFNNFNMVYLLTRGGPPIAGAQTPAGHTDILITYTYRIAFQSGRGQDFGLATAISVLIFLQLIVIAAISFRQTRRLEGLL